MRYMCLCIHTHICMYICVCVYIYIYIYMCGNTALLSHSELPQGKFLHRDSPNPTPLCPPNAFLSTLVSCPNKGIKAHKYIFFKKKSELLVYSSQFSLFSQNCKKQSLNCEIKSCNYLLIFFYWRKLFIYCRSYYRSYSLDIIDLVLHVCAYVYFLFIYLIKMSKLDLSLVTYAVFLH